MEMIAQPQTLRHLLAEFDLGPLFDQIEADRPYGCHAVDHIDDYPYAGQYRFILDVTYVCGFSWDEDGCSPDLCKQRITLDVPETATVSGIVSRLLSEISALLEA